MHAPVAMRRLAVAAVAVVVTILAVACSSLPPHALDRSGAGATIEGRISVRYRNLETDKDEALSGRFVWTTSGDAVELSLLDPLGQTVALVRSSPGRSSITFRDGRRVEGATPESVTEQTLGWTVPLRGLGHWLDGRTDDAASVANPVASPVTKLADGRLRQDGWTIRFVGDDALPKRVDLSYPGPPAEIDLRLVIDQRSGS